MKNLHMNRIIGGRTHRPNVIPEPGDASEPEELHGRREPENKQPKENNAGRRTARNEIYGKNTVLQEEEKENKLDQISGRLHKSQLIRHHRTTKIGEDSLSRKSVSEGSDTRDAADALTKHTGTTVSPVPAQPGRYKEHGQRKETWPSKTSQHDLEHKKLVSYVENASRGRTAGTTSNAVMDYQPRLRCPSRRSHQPRIGKRRQAGTKMSSNKNRDCRDVQT
jgi:hypothetical protein